MVGCVGDSPPPIDPELLERLRRGVPLTMSRTGELRFDGEGIAHARVHEALRHGIDVTEDGEPIVRLGPQWCYLRDDDLPLRIVGVERSGDALRAALDDGRAVPLDPATIWEEPDAGLRAEVPSRHGPRRIPARFSNRAQVELSAWMDLDADPVPVLQLGARRFPIAAHAPAVTTSAPA
jgi:hypothetical protein